MGERVASDTLKWVFSEKRNEKKNSNASYNVMPVSHSNSLSASDRLDIQNALRQFGSLVQRESLANANAFRNEIETVHKFLYELESPLLPGLWKEKKQTQRNLVCKFNSGVAFFFSLLRAV